MKNIKKIADQIIKKAKKFDDPQKEKDFAEYVQAVAEKNITKTMGGSRHVDPKTLRRIQELEQKYDDFYEISQEMTEDEWFAYQDQ